MMENQETDNNNNGEEMMENQEMEYNNNGEEMMENQDEMEYNNNGEELVEELMKEDPRIILIKNGINRGTLYTKTRGVLNAKGKYVMTLDHDNLYTYNNVFSTLYNESEKYKHKEVLL